MILKPLSAALELTLDLDIEDASLVSIINTNTTAKFIRISPDNQVIGIAAGERILLEKTAVHTLRGFDDAALNTASGGGVWATKVAYKN